MKKINGFSFIESLVAFSVVVVLVFTTLPIISLLRQEETILSDRRYISNRLHDELQTFLWRSGSLPSPTAETIRSNRVTFTFTKENGYIKGCSEWNNIKDRAEKVCLYGVEEK